MSVKRRCAWGFTLLGLGALAVVIAGGLWRPAGAIDVDGEAATFVILTGVVLMKHSGGMPRMRDWRHAGKIKALEQDVAALKKSHADMKTDLFDVMEQVITEGGGELPIDLQKTQPQITLIRGRREAG